MKHLIQEHTLRKEVLPWKEDCEKLFSHGRNGNEDFKATVRAMDEFLAENGFLKGKPTLE